MDSQHPVGDAPRSPAGPDVAQGPDSSTPTVACPLCGGVDARAEQEWTQEERKRLEAYTQGQLDMVRLQREDFLKHRSEVEAALAFRGQALNRQLRQFETQAGRLAQADKDFAHRAAQLAQNDAALAARVAELAGRQRELDTLHAAVALREQAAGEREAEIERRAAEVAAFQAQLTQVEKELAALQGDHDAQRLRGAQLRAENEQLDGAVQAARQQLTVLEAEHARRAAALSQREETVARREQVAWVQEPVGSSSRGSGSSLIPIRPVAADPPAPASGSARGLGQTPAPASGSAPGAPRPPAPASGSAPGTTRPPSATGSTLLAPTRTPASGSASGAGNPEDQRGATRRRGNPVSVQITNDQRTTESWPGWVVDRSTEGLCLLTDESADEGTVLNVRPSKAGPSARWIQVIVRSTVQERSSWKLGCQFLQKLTWDDLQYFG